MTGRELRYLTDAELRARLAALDVELTAILGELKRRSTAHLTEQAVIRR